MIARWPNVNARSRQRPGRLERPGCWWAFAVVLAAAALSVTSTCSAEPLLLAQFGGRMFQLEEQQLFSWAFENQTSIASARQRATDLLEGQIDFVAVIGDVTPQQRNRLLLAGQGDISRFFAYAERIIAEQPRGNMDQEEWQKVWQTLSPIRERFAQGLTGRGSLFEKTIRSTLSSEQWEAYQQLVEQRDRRNYRALVAAAVAELEIKVPLTRKQRERLIETVSTQTAPPKTKLNNYMQYMFVMYRMSKMKDEDLRPIFDDVEFRTMKNILRQAEGYAAQFEQQERGGVGGLLNFLF